jgi:glycosyltransferase involved in cell wall biosynthesis
MSLVAISTHPIQYHAPVYRVLQQGFGIPVTVIYGSDFSVAGYRDPQFGVSFAWDTDLLSGYTSVFLSRVGEGGASSTREVSARGLGRALRQSSYRAILLTGYCPRFHQSAFLRAKMVGVPLLFRGETTDHNKIRSPFQRLARGLLLRMYYRHYAGLLYVGKRSLEHFRNVGCSPSRLFFSPYCVDTSPFRTDEGDRGNLRESVRRELSIADGRFVVLFSGKLISIKAPELLVRSAKSLPEEVRRRIVVVIVGDGAMRGDLERECQTDPSVDCRFVGFVNQRALSQYYHGADVLVLPSLGETWGLVVNEALLHGLPCVVSSMVGSAADLVESGLTGEVFESGSSESLAAALHRAMGLIGRDEVRDRCREKVAGYTVEKAAEGIAAAYERVTSEKRGEIGVRRGVG